MTKQSPKAVKQVARTTRARTKAAKAKFDAAHTDGMAALKRGDYDALGDAIKREREAVDSLPRMHMTKRRQKSD